MPSSDSHRGASFSRPIPDSGRSPPGRSPLRRRIHGTGSASRREKWLTRRKSSSNSWSKITCPRETPDHTPHCPYSRTNFSRLDQVVLQVAWTVQALKAEPPPLQCRSVRHPCPSFWILNLPLEWPCMCPLWPSIWSFKTVNSLTSKRSNIHQTVSNKWHCSALRRSDASDSLRTPDSPVTVQGHVASSS